MKEICDFEWSEFLLDPSQWDQQPQATNTETKDIKKNTLDLHMMGLGEMKAAVVLAGQLPRVAEHYKP